MTESSDTYSGTTNGITYSFSVYKYGKSCSFSCVFSGTNQVTDPIIFLLPLKYRPSVRVRVTGYPTSITSANHDLIIYEDGNVRVSGGAGEAKNPSDVGCGYVTSNF